SWMFSLVTAMPVRDTFSTMPWAFRCSRASRTGVLDTLNCSASFCSSMTRPGGNSPLRMLVSMEILIRSLFFIGELYEISSIDKYIYVMYKYFYQGCCLSFEADLYV